MTFRFDYVEPEKLGGFRLIPEGDGTFRVIDVAMGVSRAGNQQLEVKMVLTCGGESTNYIYYIGAQHASKVKYLCDAIGHPQLYNESGELDPTVLIGSRGACVIKTEVSKDPAYKDKSVVARFIESTVISEEVDNGLPF